MRVSAHAIRRDEGDTERLNAQTRCLGPVRNLRRFPRVRAPVPKRSRRRTTREVAADEAAERVGLALLTPMDEGRRGRQRVQELGRQPSRCMPVLGADDVAGGIQIEQARIVLVRVVHAGVRGLEVGDVRVSVLVRQGHDREMSFARPFARALLPRRHRPASRTARRSARGRRATPRYPPAGALMARQGAGGVR